MEAPGRFRSIRYYNTPPYESDNSNIKNYGGTSLSLSSHGILAPALRAGYGNEVGVSLEHEAANAAPEVHSSLVYLVHVYYILS